LPRHVTPSFDVDFPSIFDAAYAFADDLMVSSLLLPIFMSAMLFISLLFIAYAPRRRALRQR